MRLYLSSFHFGRDTKRFQKLAAGTTRAAVIMNAADTLRGPDSQSYVQREFDDLRALGIEADELDLRQFFGREQDLATTLQRYGLVWTMGGNSFVLRRAMAYSGFDDVILKRLQEDDIIYGGYSAGAVVATPTLRGIELVDDPHEIPPGYVADVVWDGMNLVPFSIAPHYRSTHPESAAIERVVEYFQAHEMPYRALRDGDAVVVDGGPRHAPRHIDAG